MSPIHQDFGPYPLKSKNYSLKPETMFDQVTASILNRFVGDYLNISHLDLSIWQGDIVLEDVEILPRALNHLNLPFKVVAGNVGKLEVKLPWQHLKTQPAEVLVSDLRLVAVPDSAVPYNSEAEQQDTFQLKMAVLERFESWSKSEATATTPPMAAFELDDLSYSEQLIANIKRNLRVHIETVHVRYEDEPSNLGLVIEAVKVDTTNANWAQGFITEDKQTAHKAVTLHGLAVYANVGPNLTNRRTLVPTNEDKRRILDELDRVTQIVDQELFDEGGRDQLDYIIEPISVSIHLSLTKNPANNQPPFSIPEIVAEIAVRRLAIGMSKSQFESVVGLTHSLEPVQPLLRWSKLRPTEAVKGHCRLWWKFAFNCVKQVNHYSWTQIKQYRHMFKQYTELKFQLLLDEEIGASNQDRIKAYETELNLVNLVLGQCLAQLEYDREQKLEREPGTRWFDTIVESDTREAVERRIHEPWNAEEKQRIREAIDFCGGRWAWTSAPPRPPAYVSKRILFKLKEFEVFSKAEAQVPRDVFKLWIEAFDFSIDLHPGPHSGFKFEWKLNSVHVVRLTPPPVDAESDDTDAIPIPHYLFKTKAPAGAGTPGHEHDRSSMELIFEKLPVGSPTAEKMTIVLNALEIFNHSQIVRNLNRLSTEKRIQFRTQIPTDPIARRRFRIMSLINFLIVYPYLVLNAMAEE